MMKNLTFLVLLIIISSCKNDDDSNTPTNPIDQLPPATQTGANTAGALVNGEAFLPNNGSVIPLNLDYINQQDFALGIGNETNNDLYSLLISRQDTQLQENVTYILNTGFGDNSSRAEYVINVTPPPSPMYYSTTTSVTGELTITHHDFNNAILSGTFWFDAINSEGDIVEVRSGRFDMEY